jgi:hypothetical protein
MNNRMPGSAPTEFPRVLHRDFRLWSYGAGHSTLMLRSRADGDGHDQIVLFEATQFMKLHTDYPQLTIRRGTEVEEHLFEQLGARPGVPRLRLVLGSRAGSGLVSWGRVSVRVVESAEASDWGTPLLWATASPASPGFGS